MSTPTLRSVPPGDLALDLQAFERACVLFGVTQTGRLAEAFGVNRNTMGRIRSGQSLPSTQFISGVLRAWRSVRFDDLFVPIATPRRGWRPAA
jgi:DNA-binding XRE family transcriptional regulator